MAKADARGGERPREEKEEKGASPKASGLQGVIAQRVAPEPADREQTVSIGSIRKDLGCWPI